MSSYLNQKPVIMLLASVFMLSILMVSCVAAPTPTPNPTTSTPSVPVIPTITPSIPTVSSPTPTVEILPTNSPMPKNTIEGINPIAQNIAETYDVPYEQVMAWFADGFSFENILIALETGEAIDVPPEELLDKLLVMEWEQIWDEYGFVPIQ